MANLSVISFNTGEVTPQIDARSDIEKYTSSCRILENFIATIYGAVTRRPGTKYIATAKNTDESIRMVPFIFSSTTAYVCEFGDLYIRFYLDNEQLTSEGSAVEVVTTYLEVDLPQLQFEQIGDVMWITHSSYAPAKLTRTSATAFSLDDITFDKGPFLIRNDIENSDDVTMTPAGLTIETQTAATNKFTIDSATDISGLFPANQRFYVSGSIGNDGGYTVHASTATTYVGTTVTITTNEDFTDDTNTPGDIFVAGGTGTITASVATFTTGTSGHAGALWKMTQPRIQTVTSASAGSQGLVGQAIDVKGAFSFNAFGTWTATVELQRNEDGTNWETFRTFVGANDKQIIFNSTEPDDNIQYRMWVSAYSSGPINMSFTVNNSTQDSIARISSVTSTTVIAVTWVVPPPSVTATKRWAEGAWSAVQGYPSSVGSIGGRIVYGGTSDLAQTLWLSEVDLYEDFEPGTSDSDSFEIPLTTTNTIRWIGSLEVLVVGTSGDEWIIQSSKLDSPLTPTDFFAKQQSQYGSSAFQTQEAGTAILFVDFVGRKVREFIFDDNFGKYRAPDLNAFAEHITEDVIVGTAFQRNPDPILWAWTTNGILLSMTYERDQNVIAWAKHLIGGTDAKVLSAAVIPSSAEDEIWLAVSRTINSATAVYVEQMQPRDWGDEDGDAFFVDAGITDTSATTTISGLDHLEGEEVAVLLDGAIMARETVASGAITISEAGVTAQVGLPYRYKLKPMRFDVTGQIGSTKGSIKKISEIVVSFFKSRDVQYGRDVDNLTSISWRTEEVYGSPPDFFTGDRPVPFDAGFDPEDPILLSGDDPSPCTIRAIIARTRVTGRLP